MWDPLHDKLVCVGNVICGGGGCFVDLIAPTNGRKPVHATALAACRTTLFMHTNQRSHLHRLPTVRCWSYPCAFTFTHNAGVLSSCPNRFPLTCMHADCCRLCRCVSSICLQHRLFSCQCADSDFSTLPYEMRDGDAGALQEPQCLTVHVGLKCDPCLNV